MADSGEGGLSGWLPALTAIIGFMSSQVLEWLKDSRSHKRERESRNEARQDKMLEKRAEEQRQTLLDLQDAVQQMFRDTSEIQMYAIRSLQSGSELGKKIYPEGLSDRAHGSYVQMTKLMVRVRDQEIRDHVAEFKSVCENVYVADSEERSNKLMMAATYVIQTLNERIGNVLRQLDDIEMSL